MARKRQSIEPRVACELRLACDGNLTTVGRAMCGFCERVAIKRRLIPRPKPQPRTASDR